MALKGIKPEMKEKRLKLFLYGPAGVGKTTAAIQFPQSYIIDMERGQIITARASRGQGPLFSKPQTR